MVIDDKPANQKVTLSTETIELINESAGEGESYDTIIQNAVRAKAEENRAKKAKRAEAGTTAAAEEKEKRK